jgi:Mor family transcriptional regulator
MRQKRKQGEDLLADLAAKIKASLTELAELDPNLSDHISNEVVNQMSDHWGGSLVYFPQGMSRKISARDLAIWEKFNGTNHPELAREYHISLQWVYRIVKTMRKQQINSRQGGLFTTAE